MTVWPDQHARELTFDFRLQRLDHWFADSFGAADQNNRYSLCCHVRDMTPNCCCVVCSPTQRKSRLSEFSET